jgi:hypothetical protein
MKEIEFEYTPGTAVTPPRRFALEAKPTSMATIAVSATIGEHEYSAVIYRDGGIDLYQPAEGADQRAKKTLYIASIQRLNLFLLTVEAQARLVFGADWGQE